jgi:uncharacterized protein (TIGR04255 family)
MDSELETYSNGLPSYRKPPIDEVVCGLRFKTPVKLFLTHFGLLWDRFSHQGYKTVQHAAPIVLAKGEIPLDNTTNLPLPRVWFINESDDQLVQFQVDRVYFNWRRRQAEYPRYRYVIKTFEVVWSTMTDFFHEFELGEFVPIEYELTYLNTILKGEGWETINDLPNVFRDFNWTPVSGRFLPGPRNMAWNSVFDLPGNRGRLIVSLKEGIRIRDKTPLLRLELRAEDKRESENRATIREWFDLAHEWIVRGFTDLTTPEIQKLWEREV